MNDLCSVCGLTLPMFDENSTEEGPALLKDVDVDATLLSGAFEWHVQPQEKASSFFQSFLFGSSSAGFPINNIKFV